MTRFLRPSSLVATADSVWAIDAFQPVAVRLDPLDGDLLGAVAWAELPAQPVGTGRAVAADARHVWVQQGGTLALLGTDGVRRTTELSGVTLYAAGGPGAWLAEVSYLDVGEAGPDGTWLPAPPLPDGRIVLVTPDGGHREVRVDRPVRELAADADGLLVTVAERPPEAIPIGSGGHTFDYHEATFRVPWRTLPRALIVCAEHARVDPGCPGVLGWLEPRPGAGWQVDGLWWSAGWDLGGSKIERPLFAVGVDDVGVQRGRVPLGTGTITGGVRIDDRIWLAVSRGRFLHVDADAPAEVIVLDPAARRATRRLAPDAVTIAEQCWPVPPAAPSDATAHAERWLARMQGFGAFWTDEAGAVTPLADGMSEVRSVLHGAWPDLAVQVSFRHPYYPGGVLRRRIPLFDEIGRPVEPEYADIGLMEDLDTFYLPPVAEAVDGVLEI